MLSVATITFPFFALVLCGYLAARWQWLPLPAIPGLNSFVLFFALPCLLYRLGARTPLQQLWMPQAAVVYGVCALLMVAGVIALTVRRWGHNDAAMGALVAAFPNTGFMGLPLVAVLVGEAAAAPALMVIAIDMIVTSSLCVAISRWDASAHASLWPVVRRALGGVLRNPMPWAMVLGACASGWAWHLPSPLERTVDMLADAASPVALFTIGAVLARSQVQHHDKVAWASVVPIAVAKLALHPVLIVAVAALAAQCGYGLPSIQWQVLVMMAALPSASNVSLLAERLQAHGGRIARIILVSTAIAFVSFPAVVALVQRWR